jgi:hypothetical protein
MERRGAMWRRLAALRMVYSALSTKISSNACSVENLVEQLVEKPLPEEAAPA